MDNNQKRLHDLLELYKANLISPDELQELGGILNTDEPGAQQWLNRELKIALEHNEPGTYNADRLQAILQAIRIDKTNAPVHSLQLRDRRIHFLKRFRWAAAASVIVIAGIGALFFANQSNNNITIAQAKVNVAAPASNKLTITLGNGKTVGLDNAGNGQLALENGVQLVKLADGKFAYSGTAEGKIVYNTATNPVGSQVADLKLTDGTHIWLNAGSSVTYPIGMETRNVTMNGEAYFEVAKNPKKPFTVKKGDVSVTVLGTHFNIKAYDNEAALKVTLLEGSVKVLQKNMAQLLQPNQQAIVGERQITLVKDADVQEAMAWKQGRVMFNETDVQSVLKEIERWYDVEAVMEGKESTRKFYMNVPRGVTLDEMLGVLRDNGFKYEYDAAKRKLIVRS